MSTRQKLIDAATTLLDRGGESAVTLRAVAQLVGVSHNTPYRHFADRAALLAGVAEQDFRTFCAAFETISRSEAAAITKVKAALEAFIRYGEAHTARYRLLFGDPDIATRGGTLEAAALATFTSLSALVGAAQAQGDLPAIPNATMTSLLYATLHGLLDLRAGGRMRAEKGFSNVLNGTSLLLELIRPASAT